VGSYVLRNVGPDEPYGGGEPAEPGAEDDFDAADPDTTGQILQFRVVPARSPDPTTPPQWLQLPALTPLPPEARTRPLALIEKAGVGFDADGNEVEGPIEALLGIVRTDGRTKGRLWADKVTENPGVGDTEVWEIYNTTADAHPIHIHELTFEVVNRQDLVLDEEEVVQPIQLAPNTTTPPEPWETGFKDTVVALPGQVTRVRAQFLTAGQFVWHCHIVEHEDNEMMRPYRIGRQQAGQPPDPEHS
jgi:FtsP/CotA-like multicopper oxidase with cupredoxin domain